MNLKCFNNLQIRIGSKKRCGNQRSKAKAYWKTY